MLNQPDFTAKSLSTIPAITLSAVVRLLGVFKEASRRPSMAISSRISCQKMEYRQVPQFGR